MSRSHGLNSTFFFLFFTGAINPEDWMEQQSIITPVVQLSPESMKMAFYKVITKRISKRGVNKLDSLEI